jgi:hypothetical protein
MSDDQVMGDSKKCLFVILRPKLALAMVEQCPEDRIVLEGETYQDKGFGYATGFYDWLRESTGIIVGVRYWPQEPHYFPFRQVEHLSYLVTTEGIPCVEIYFSPNQEFDNRQSDDQAFGDNKIFSTDQGEYLITFGTYTLTHSELKSILAVEADWIT